MESLEEGVLLATLGLAVLGAIVALRKSALPPLSMWGVVFAGCVLLIAAEGGRILLRHSLGAGAEEQWLLAGVIEIVFYALVLLTALSYLAGRSTIGWLLGLLDTAVVAICIVGPWLVFVLSRLDEAGGRAMLPQLLSAAPAGVVLVVCLMTLHASTVGSSWAYLLPAALAAGMVGDVLVSLRLLDGGGGVGLSGWEARALLVILATTYAGRAPRMRDERRPSVSVMRISVVILAYLGAVAFSAYAFIRGDQLSGFAVASTVSALFLLRLLLHAFDRHRHSEQLVQALREQEQLAVMDSLTGLYNRRFLDAELRLELDRGARSRQPVGILLCDLDHFKQINDRYGHLVGDSVLREVARRLLAAVRNGDLVARYGGEEFVVLLPGGGKEQLSEIGERCRRSFDETPFPLPRGEANVTISIGGACWPDDASTAQRLLQSADMALYRAKELGRNRIHIIERGELTTESSGEILQPSRDSALAGGLAVSAKPACGEAEKMQKWARLVARAMGLDDSAQRSCAMAARFRDIGKSVLPDSILAKEGPLTPVEWELVFEHPDRGARLVELAPGLEQVASIIREHHERYDGRGYPLGKCREEISTEARIVACCDAWSAMREDRPFARAKTASEARAELLAGRGTQFDPEVVMAFLMIDEEDLEAVRI